MNVLLPEPLAPTRPYRLPALSCSETPENSVRAPYSLARAVVAIMPGQPRILVAHLSCAS